MEPAEIRTTLGQLADDFAWLEQHARAKPQGANLAQCLRFAGGLVRNVVGPQLEGQTALPLHLAVVGGAGVGKSTVANLLVGEAVAESNPQAGFTRHPIAYAKADQPWPASAGFLATLRRLERPESARLDEDVYQVRRLAADKPEHQLLEKFVVWDCPDMTTYAAAHYLPRLVEVASLADVLVYVASDERYNDEVPTEFLKHFLAAGKTVVVLLLKMREADVSAFLSLFEREVGAKLPAKPLAVLPIPQLSAAELADPIRNAARFRIPIVNQIAVTAQSPDATRRASVQAAWAHVRREQSRLLSAATDDLSALEGWRRLVHEGQAAFEDRYRKEHLAAEKFRRFDETLVRLLELLELPAVGQILSKGLNLLRMPYTLVKSWFRREPPPMAPEMAEKPVLEAGFRAWIDHVRKETAARKDTHSLWAHVQGGFQKGLANQAEARFQELNATFHGSLSAEVERTALAILEDLQKNPVALNTLRGAKFALDIGAVVGGIFVGGFTPLSAVLAPLGASVTQYLVDLLGESYVKTRREETRTRQLELFRDQLSTPLAATLVHWPTSGGSVYERLQTIARRVPAHLDALEPLVKAS